MFEFSTIRTVLVILNGVITTVDHIVKLVKSVSENKDRTRRNAHSRFSQRTRKMDNPTSRKSGETWGTPHANLGCAENPRQKWLRCRSHLL
jgi:hypothetical protein